MPLFPVIDVVAETPGRQTRVFAEGRTITREYERAWRVIADPNFPPPGTLGICASFGLPWFGSTYVGQYEYDTGAFAHAFDARDQENSPWDFTVKVSYSSKAEIGLMSANEAPSPTSPDNPSNNAGINPILRPVILDRDFRRREEPLEDDAQGNPAVNAAGEPFDPSVMDEEYNLVYLIKKNSFAWDDGVASAAIGATNSVRWFGNIPNTCKLQRWRATQAQENNFIFYEQEIEVELQVIGWDWQILNRGNKALDVNGNRMQPIDPSGNGAPGPFDLKPNGRLGPSQFVTGVAGPAFTVASTLNFTIGDSIRIVDGAKTEDCIVGGLTGTVVVFANPPVNAHGVGCKLVITPNYVRLRRRQIDFNPLNFLFPG